MNELAWYYDLCRLLQGGFSLLPSPPDKTRYTGAAWGQGLGLTYTAPRKTLRITGGGKTRFSKTTAPIKPAIWGRQRDRDFLATDHAEGFGEELDAPHVAHSKLKGRSREEVSVEYVSKYMRHNNPVFRTLAARKLIQHRSDAAYAQVEAALQHKDVRVRRAACDAISGYENWYR